MTNQQRGPTSSEQQRQLERVRALLAKAESTIYPEEAAALTAKAHELMVAHAINSAMIQEKTGQGEICTIRVNLHAPYVKKKYLLLSAVAKPNNCQAILGIEKSYFKELMDSGGFSDLPEGMRMATVVGYRSDLDVVELLFTSLLVQAVNLMMSHGSVVTSWGNETRSFRNAFLHGFGQTIRERLQKNTEDAAISSQHASRAQALPVLASRAARVQLATEEKFPNTTPLRSSVSNGHGFNAGQQAGDRADIGSTRFQPPSRSLPPSST